MSNLECEKEFARRAANPIRCNSTELGSNPIASNSRELELYRADHKDVQAAGFHCAGELLSAYKVLLTVSKKDALDAKRYRTTLLAIKHKLEGQQVWDGRSLAPVYLHPRIFNNVLVQINEALAQQAGDTK